MDFVSILGLSAGFLTTIASLPQIIRTLKLKHTKDISLMMYLLIFFGVFLWLLYGILLGDMPLILANSVSLALILVILVLKFKYG